MRKRLWALSYGLFPPETPKNYPYLTRRYTLQERLDNYRRLKGELDADA